MGTMNAYVAAAARLAGALAEEGSAPAGLASPARALALLATVGALLLVALGADLIGVEGLVRATSASFVAVYVTATAAGVHLLAGPARAAAAVAFVAVVAVLAFSGPFLVVPAVVAVAALARPGQRLTRLRTATAVSGLSANSPSTPSR
jgi:amino acid efflux transporter